MSPCQRHPMLSRRAIVRFGATSLVPLAIPAAGAAQMRKLAPLESNKAIIQRIFSEPLAAGNAKAIRDLYSTEFLVRGAWSQHVPELDDLPRTIVAFRESYPELSVTVDPILAEADLVASVATWRGAHLPAGMHVVGRTVHVFRLADDRIVEEWSTGWDSLVAALPDDF